MQPTEDNKGADTAPSEAVGNLRDPHTIAPIFVVGAARSGTTLLRMHLLGHPDIRIPNESWFLLDLSERFSATAVLTAADLADAVRIVEGHRRWKDWASSRYPLRPLFEGQDSLTLPQFVDALFRLETGAGGLTRWGDKTPGYVSLIPWLADAFPQAQFIHIVRDGRDVFLSLRRRGWRGRTPFQLGRYWRDCVRRADAAFRQLSDSRRMTVRYEDLVLDTARQLQRICEFLGVSVTPSMVDFHERAAAHVAEWELTQGIHTKLLRPPEPSDVAQWRRIEKTAQLSMASGLMARELRRYDYPESFPPVSAALWASAATAHYVLRPRTVIGKAGRWLRQHKPTVGPGHG